MTAPTWINAMIGDFGRAAGINGLALNDRGAAALAFETGASLKFEYTGEELVVAVTVPHSPDTTSLKHLLALSHPQARFGFKVRTGYLARSGCMVMAVRLAERDVTLPTLNAVFSVLWRLAGEIGGGQWH